MSQVIIFGVQKKTNILRKIYEKTLFLIFHHGADRSSTLRGRWIFFCGIYMKRYCGIKCKKQSVI